MLACFSHPLPITREDFVRRAEKNRVALSSTDSVPGLSSGMSTDDLLGILVCSHPVRVAEKGMDNPHYVSSSPKNHKWMAMKHWLPENVTADANGHMNLSLGTGAVISVHETTRNWGTNFNMDKDRIQRPLMATFGGMQVTETDQQCGQKDVRGKTHRPSHVLCLGCPQYTSEMQKG